MLLTYPFFLYTPELEYNEKKISNTIPVYLQNRDIVYKTSFDNSNALININEFNTEENVVIDREKVWESLFNFANKLLKNSKPMPPRIQKIINEEFWNLI